MHLLGDAVQPNADYASTPEELAEATAFAEQVVTSTAVA